MTNVFINKAGNLIPKGNFVKHSEFKEVVNFINSQQHILTAAYDEKYLSPISLIISGVNLSNIEKINVYDDKIEFYGIDFYFNEIDIYNSFFEYKNNLDIDLKSKIQQFENNFLHKLNEKSLKFLLDEKFEKSFETSFEKAFVEHSKSAFNEIKNGDLLQGISKMKGSGFGLTPSGDDFIAGMLYAIDIQKYFSHCYTIFDVQRIAEVAYGSNPISNSLIYYASKGAYYKRFRDFIYAFLYDEKNLERAFNNLTEIGETSSSDTLTGFFSQLKVN